MKSLNSILMGGHEVLPLIEGGKGVAVSTGASSGAWAAAGGVGTVSAVNADTYNEDGSIHEQIYHGKTRRERFEELIEFGIAGGIEQVQKAHEIRGGAGALNINVLWEMGGSERILHGILEKTKGMVNGVTCGAGMPYRLAEITAQYGVHYYPIVSSARAFNALWRRAYSKCVEYLGAVVYEDPWLAGGHNGLSNVEDPKVPQDPYPRVKAIRDLMRKLGVSESIPIIMAGGVWYLRDWENWIDNEELGPIAFQYGTRPLLTKESEISNAWKQRLMTVQEGDVLLHQFSPTGFYSSAIKNKFLNQLVDRSARQIAFSPKPEGDLTTELALPPRGRVVYVKAEDKPKAEAWIAQGFTEGMKTPDDTMVFAAPEEAATIRTNQKECMGCLSHCMFSNWADNEKNSTGRKVDPRSFCIQKTLQGISHTDRIEDYLMFAGHNAFNFGTDPFYSNGYIPTVKQLVDRIASGD